MLKGKVQYLL